MNSGRPKWLTGGELFVIALSISISSLAYAHHSGSIFDQNSVVALEGTVSEFSWSNPHVYIHVETVSSTGEITEWQIETDATPILTRSGWSSASLQPGDQVVVRANPDKNPQRAHGRLLSVATAEGALLTPRLSFESRPSESSTAAAATDLSGIWSTPTPTRGHRWWSSSMPRT